MELSIWKKTYQVWIIQRLTIDEGSLVFVFSVLSSLFVIGIVLYNFNDILAKHLVAIMVANRTVHWSIKRIIIKT